MEPLKKNVATREAQTQAERKRIPMSVPVQKLAAPDMPGYHLHWFTSDPARIQRALDAGYEFVDSKDLNISHMPLGSDSTVSGNQDLGSQVSIVSGTDARGQTQRLILMKIKEEWWQEDQRLVEQRNDQVAEALAGGLMGSEQEKNQGDIRLRYVGSRTALPEMFRKKAAK